MRASAPFRAPAFVSARAAGGPGLQSLRVPISACGGFHESGPWVYP
jgi:hypothetical protein